MSLAIFSAKNTYLGLGVAVFFMASTACSAKSPALIKKNNVETTVETTKVSADPVKPGRGNPVLGKEKSELCQGCHGEDGNSPDSMTPKLAGQNASYITKQLRNYQVGTRSHQIMSDIAATSRDEDLDDISAYFASRPQMKGNGAVNKLGKDLYLRGDMSRMIVACVNCHGANGEGKSNIDYIFPVIGGQHKDYLLGQFNSFKAGDRSNSPGGVMNIMVQKMSAAEIEALADYVSGL